MPTKSNLPFIRLRSLLSPALLCLGSSLLAGSVLAQTDSASTSANPDEVVTLSPFAVTGQHDQGYSVSSASTATRTNTPLIDIPQTVDIVTSQMWADMDSTTWDESFKYVANAFVRNRNAGGGDDINIRGFQATNNSIAVDGMLVGDQHYKRDLVGYDRLEIVKGPPSAVQGRAGGTGLFNYIMKKPDLSAGDFTDVKLTVGTDDYGDNFVRGELDSNYLLNSSGTFGGRIAAAWQRSDDYIKFQHNSLVSIYPSFRWKLNDKTELIMTNEILKDLTPSREEGHGAADYPYKDRILFPQFNVPSDPITALHIPYNFNIAGPGENAYERVLSSNLFLTHTFNEHVAFRQSVNYRYNIIDTATFTGEDNSDTLINSQYTDVITQYHNVTAQGDLITKFEGKWISSSTLLGYNYRMEQNSVTSYAGVPNAPFNKINIVTLAEEGDPASYFAGRTVNLSLAAKTVAAPYNVGVYVEQDFGFFNDRLIINGSLRRDHDHTETDSELTGKQTAGSDTQLTSYRFGFTYKLRPNLAAYAVESLQNDPLSTTSVYNGLLAGDPRLSDTFTLSPSTKLYEFGLKGEALNGRVTFSADHWQMAKTGSVVNLLSNGISQGQQVTFGTETVLQGASTHGYEFSTFGTVTDRFNLIANYTRMYSGQQNPADPANPGDRIPLPQAPIWSWNFFGKYSFQDKHGQGFAIKAGMSMIGPIQTNVTLSSGAVQVNIPHSQKYLDAGISYQWRRYAYDLMVNNVDNDPFLMMRDTPPRSYKLSVSTRF